MRVLKSIACLVVLSVLVALLVRPAMACGVCISLAEDTISDRILSAKIVVIAAPDPESPFRFIPTDVIAGDAALLDELPPIPFLVDRAIRAKRQAGETGSVVMTFGVDSMERRIAGARLKWHRLFALNGARRQFVDDVLAKGQSWALGVTNEPDKVSFFLAYVLQNDRLLHDTALTELSRAPYPVLHAVPQFPPPDVLMQNLSQIERAAYAPIAIKLLAADNQTRGADALRARYPSGLAANSQTLHAWGIAALETDGEEALALIVQRLNAPEIPEDARLQLILALIDAGTVEQELRKSIVPVFATSLNHSLNGASDIAYALKEWEDDSLDHVFRDLLDREGLNPITAFALRASVGWDG